MKIALLVLVCWTLVALFWLNLAQNVAAQFVQVIEMAF